MSKQADDRPPSAALVREALAAMDLSASGAGRSRPVLNGIARGRFVGREPELALCKAAWLEAAAGTRRVVILEGEAGVGKTRLAQELATHVAVLGGTVLPGECYAEGAAPYAPIGEAIRQALAGDDGRSLTLPDFILQDLAVLSPSLRSVANWRPSAAADEPQAELQRLCESVVSLFECLSQQAPVMLLVEDLQWADSGTLCLLRHLAHRAHVTNLRLLILLTFRPVELVQAPGLYGILRELERNAQVTRIELQPFTREETRRMLEAMFQREITEQFLEGIHQETGGNPFFVEEACKALVTQGKLYLEAGRWERGKTMAELGIPQNLRTAILSRFSRLSPGAQDSLRRASIIGQEFEVAVLRVASDLDRELLDTCLDEAEIAQFIHAPRTATGTGERFAFAHALMPQTIADELSSVRSARLHARVGDAIEQVHADRIDLMAPALGRHYALAGQAVKAAEYLLKAGDAAQSVIAFDEAIANYEVAIPLLQQLKDSERLAQTHLKLGSLYHAGFRFDDSRHAYREGFSEERDASGVPRRGERAGHVLPPAPHPLRLAGVDPVTLDPGLTADIWDNHLAEQLFSGLLYCDPDMALLPEIAWRWEILEGGRKYLFHLRDDWKWSDGVAVTAEDFEFAWRRVLDPRTHSPSWHLLTNIHGGAAFDPGAEPPGDDLGVHAAGDWTLVVELEEPAGYFLHLLALPTAFPVPRHVVEAYGDKWTEAPHFVSNGPFRLEARASGEPWVLGLRPDYPGRVRGNVEQVEIVRLREGTHEIWDPVGQSMSLYEQGRIDVAQTNFLGVEPGAPAIRPRGSRLAVARHLLLWPNWRRRPLDDPRVRQALGLGMDRSLVVALTYGEAAIPADGGFVARGVPGHSPGIGLSFDPDQARRLLSEAGFPGGRGFPPICLLHSMAQQNHDLARNLTEQWQQALGIRIETCGVDYYTYMDRIRAREYDLFVICWTADYPDPDTFLGEHSPATARWSGAKNTPSS